MPAKEPERAISEREEDQETVGITDAKTGKG